MRTCVHITPQINCHSARQLPSAGLKNKIGKQDRTRRGAAVHLAFDGGGGGVAAAGVYCAPNEPAEIVRARHSRCGSEGAAMRFIEDDVGADGVVAVLNGREAV